MHALTTIPHLAERLNHLESRSCFVVRCIDGKRTSGFPDRRTAIGRFQPSERFAVE